MVSPSITRATRNVLEGALSFLISVAFGGVSGASLAVGDSVFAVVLPLRQRALLVGIMLEVVKVQEIAK